MYRDVTNPEQTGAGAPFDVLGFVRRLIPFAHFPFRNGQRDGTAQQLVAVFSAPNTDTAFKLSLGRVPSEYITGRRTVAGTVYDASTGTTAWTPNSITLRATAAGTYYIRVF